MRRMTWVYFPKTKRLHLSYVFDNRNLPLLAAQLTSIVSVSSTSDIPPGIFDTPIYSRRRSYELLNPKVGVLEYGSLEKAIFQFAITLDPLSETAQKWSTIIQVDCIKILLIIGTQ
jgi:UDP-glucose:glycoprotein glucosyltransferase